MVTVEEILEQLESERESRIRREPGMRGILRSLQIALVRRRIRKLVVLYDTIVVFDAYAMYPHDRRPNMFLYSTPKIRRHIRCRTLLGTVVISGREMLVMIDESRATAHQSLKVRLSV
jgi:hypothetical protein